MEDKIKELENRIENIEKFLSTVHQTSWKYHNCFHVWQDGINSTAPMRTCQKCGVSEMILPLFHTTTG